MKINAPQLLSLLFTSEQSGTGMHASLSGMSEEKTLTCHLVWQKKHEIPKNKLQNIKRGECEEALVLICQRNQYIVYCDTSAT